MKSSSTTRSAVPLNDTSLTNGPKAALPLVMPTKPIGDPTLAMTPKNDRPPLGDEGTVNLPSRIPAVASNKLRFEVFDSTSENTAPKPRISAWLLVPGMKKFTPVTFEVNGVKSRCGLNCWKVLV